AIRDDTARKIREAAQAVQTFMGMDGPVRFTKVYGLETLRSRAQERPDLGRIVAAIEHQAVRNEMALLRYYTARRLSLPWMRKPESPLKGDPHSKEYAEQLLAERARMCADPIYRAEQGEWDGLCEVVLWAERAVTALDAGRNATYHVAHAFACYNKLAHM